jgi:hypothetical protein
MKIASAKDKDLLCRLLISCGGTRGAMQAIAARLKASDSLDLTEILGKLVIVSEPIREIMATCQSVNGAIDTEGLVRHFSSVSHLHKMSDLSVTVASELPKEQIAVAHTLLPLTLVEGNYCYDNGEAHVRIDGLVQIGPSKGQPYAHLAGIIWIEGDNLWSEISMKQQDDGVAARASELVNIDYSCAPKLRLATLDGAKQLGYSA